MRRHFATTTADDSKFRSLVGSRVGQAWPEQSESSESPLTLACEGCQAQFSTDELCWTATGRYCTACASLMEEVNAFRTISTRRQIAAASSPQPKSLFYHPIFLAAAAVGLVVSSSVFSWEMCKTLNPPADDQQPGVGSLVPQKIDPPKNALARELDANAFVANHEFGGNAGPSTANPSTEPADADEFRWTRVDPPQATTTAPATEPAAATAPDAAANPQPAPAPAPEAAAADPAPAVAPVQPDAAAAAAPAQGDAAPAAAEATAKPPTLNDMRREAWQMLIDGSWASAHIRFNRLIDDLPNDRGCEIGMTMADYESGDPPSIKRAVRELEKFYNESPDAFITVNFARVLLPANPARSAHMLADYLRKTQSTDEMILNALGTALAACERDNIQAVSISQFRQVYFETEQRLEIATNNNKRRWGADWLPAEEATTNWATLREALKSLHAAQRRIVLAKTDYRESDWQRKEAAAGSDSNASTAQTFDALLQEQISDFNNVPKPKWPDEIPLRFPDPVPESK